MSKPQGYNADRTTDRSPSRVGLLRYVPIATALVVALVSAFTLTAYDKPLDRQALTPSVMEFMDGSIQPVSAPQNGSSVQAQPHAMLLRYDLGKGEAPVIAWHPWELSVPVHGASAYHLDSML